MEQLIGGILAVIGMFVAFIIMIFAFAIVVMMFGFVMTLFFSLLTIVLDLLLLPIIIADVGLMALVERKLGRPAKGWKEEVGQYALLIVVNTVLIAAAASFWLTNPLQIILPAIAIGTIAAISSSEWSFVPALIRGSRSKTTAGSHEHAHEHDED